MLTVMAIVLQIAAPPIDPFADRAWGHFSRSPTLEHRTETVDIGTDGNAGGVVQYKLRLTQRFRDGSLTRVWADSRSCPAVHMVMARLRALKPPAIVPPGLGPAPTEILVDGIGYGLTMPVEDQLGLSRMTWTSDVGTPLADWVEDSLARLKSCWRPKP